MSDDVARTMPTIELPDTPDPFAGSPELVKMFYAIADYLSLWCALYGLREDHIRTSKVAWRDAHMMLFRVMDRHGRAVSPTRYDPRLPDVDRVFVSRYFRIKRFVATQTWFRDKLREVDRAHRAYLARWHLTPADVEVTNRWTDSGIVLFAYVWKSTPATNRRYHTHLKHADYGE